MKSNQSNKDLSRTHKGSVRNFKLWLWFSLHLYTAFTVQHSKTLSKCKDNARKNMTKVWKPCKHKKKWFPIRWEPKRSKVLEISAFHCFLCVFTRFSHSNIANRYKHAKKTMNNHDQSVKTPIQMHRKQLISKTLLRLGSQRIWKSCFICFSFAFLYGFHTLVMVLHCLLCILADFHIPT